MELNVLAQAALFEILAMTAGVLYNSSKSPLDLYMQALLPQPEKNGTVLQASWEIAQFMVVFWFGWVLIIIDFWMWAIQRLHRMWWEFQWYMEVNWRTDEFS